MKLYGRSFSGNCHKIRLLLSALHLDTQRQEVSKQDQQEAWFKELSPVAQVPVLEDQGNIVYDSLAIMEYLANQYDLEGQWLPKAPADRSKVMSWLGYVSSTVQTGLAGVYLVDFFKVPLDRAYAEKVALSSLSLLEQSLQNRPWLVGDQPSLADIAAYPYVERLQKTKLDYLDKPKITQWVNRIQAADWYVE